eukprot:scaffold13488_cov20-Tisochrysis_lutea.AAC.1
MFHLQHNSHVNEPSRGGQQKVFTRTGNCGEPGSLSFASAEPLAPNLTQNGMQHGGAMARPGG